MPQNPGTRPAARTTDAASRVRAHAWVGGRVQGVGFRFFVQHHALRLGLTGFVRNLADRRVEVVVEGPAGNAHALLDAVREGPAGARVAAVELIWEPPRGESGFVIRTDAHR